MYLEPGGIRELHWHQTAEWAYMTEGKCRVTTLSREGKPSVEDVFKGDLWFFPAGLPHSLQGLGPVGAEFVIAFDNGAQSESNTLLLTDWFAHTPPDVLAKNFGVAQEVFDDIPLHNLWIFPGEEPGDLEADQVAAGVEWGGTEPVIFRMSQSKPLYENSGGSVRVADSTNFPASKTVAAGLVMIEPGSMRELHWHPNADEWQYYMQGSARMTVFNTGPHANTTDFRAGDVGLVRRNCGHYVENTGDDVPDHDRNVPQRPLRRGLTGQLARPPAAQARLRAPEHSRGDPREIPPRRAGNRAAEIAGCIATAPFLDQLVS